MEKSGVEVFETFGCVFVNGLEVKEQGEAAGGGSEEIVSWDLEGNGKFKGGGAKGIDNESPDGRERLRD
jgi:hypothetical protein